MYKEAAGTVISVKKQWWLKVNAKRVRLHAMDGAMFPHIVKVEYTVDGQTYTQRKWIGAGYPTPSVGSSVTVLYDRNNPLWQKWYKLGDTKPTGIKTCRLCFCAMRFYEEFLGSS